MNLAFIDPIERPNKISSEERGLKGIFDSQTEIFLSQIVQKRNSIETEFC